ncbi:MAG: hypothetical protein WAM70_05060, partial [Pyrinomonadaceae bacterium]
MKNTAVLLTLGLALAAFPFISALTDHRKTAFTIPPGVQDAQQENQRDRLEKKRAKFETARRLLIEKNVPFDPEILLTQDWPKTLRTTLQNYVPEFKETRRGPSRLKGVHIAETLYLPEKVELTGDTVI